MRKRRGSKSNNSININNNVSNDDKKILVDKIQRLLLNKKVFDKVYDIINDSIDVNITDSDYIDIDFDKLDNKTIKKLQKLVNDFNDNNINNTSIITSIINDNHQSSLTGSDIIRKLRELMVYNNNIFFTIVILLLMIVIIINYYHSSSNNNNIDRNVVINTCDHLSKYKSVLVTVAHPDDIEALTGGTVAFMTSCGIKVNAVITTSGDLGFGKNMSLTNSEIANMREQEALKAGGVLGISNITFLRQPDGRLEGVDQIELKLNITKAVRLYRPDLLLSFSPEFDYNSFQFGFMHQDHKTTGQATMNVLWPSCRDALNFKEELFDKGFEPIVVPEIWLFTFSKVKLTSNPFILVNITQHFNKKYEALKEHVSQYDSSEELKYWLQKIGNYLTNTFVESPSSSTLIEVFTSVKFSL